MFRRLRALLSLLRRRMPRPRRRFPRHPGPPEGMPYIAETFGVAEAARRYEQEGRDDFDRRVAETSGTRGWETFSLFILLTTGLVAALLVAMSDLLWLAYALGAFAMLCAVLIALRWRTGRAQRRSPMRRAVRRGPMP